MGWSLFSSSPSRSPRRPSSRTHSSANSTYSASSRHYSSTSRYKRSPRSSYLEHLYAKLRHFFREMMTYARRHPYKVFFAIILPLVSGGLLTRLAHRFGIHLTAEGAASAAGLSRGAYSGATYGSERGGGTGGYYGSHGYGPERVGAGGWDMQSLAGGIGTAAGTIGSLASLAKMASQFM